MRGTKLATIGAMAAAAIALAAPAQADPTPSPPSDYDAPFKNTVNGFGIYQPQDYLAWLGKITCDRLGRGVDHDAYQSANFIQHNLPRGHHPGAIVPVPRCGG